MKALCLRRSLVIQLVVWILFFKIKKFLIVFINYKSSTQSLLKKNP